MYQAIELDHETMVMFEKSMNMKVYSVVELDREHVEEMVMVQY